jgi:hypothetical protein
MDWFIFAQQWLFNMKNIKVQWKVDFLTNWSTISYSRWALLNEDKADKGIPHVLQNQKLCLMKFIG